MAVSQTEGDFLVLHLHSAFPLMQPSQDFY